MSRYETDAQLVKGFGVHPDFVVECVDAVPQTLLARQQGEDGWEVPGTGPQSGGAPPRTTAGKRLVLTDFVRGTCVRFVRPFGACVSFPRMTLRLAGLLWGEWRRRESNPRSNAFAELLRGEGNLRRVLNTSSGPDRDSLDGGRR